MSESFTPEGVANSYGKQLENANPVGASEGPFIPIEPQPSSLPASRVFETGGVPNDDEIARKKRAAEFAEAEARKEAAERQKIEAVAARVRAETELAKAEADRLEAVIKKAQIERQQRDEQEELENRRLIREQQAAKANEERMAAAEQARANTEAARANARIIAAEAARAEADAAIAALRETREREALARERAAASIALPVHRVVGGGPGEVMPRPAPQIRTIEADPHLASFRYLQVGPQREKPWWERQWEKLHPHTKSADEIKDGIVADLIEAVKNIQWQPELQEGIDFILYEKIDSGGDFDGNDWKFINEAFRQLDQDLSSASMMTARDKKDYKFRTHKIIKARVLMQTTVNAWGKASAAKDKADDAASKTEMRAFQKGQETFKKDKESKYIILTIPGVHEAMEMILGKGREYYDPKERIVGSDGIETKTKKKTSDYDDEFIAKLQNDNRGEIDAKVVLGLAKQYLRIMGYAEDLGAKRLPKVLTTKGQAATEASKKAADSWGSVLDSFIKGSH